METKELALEDLAREAERWLAREGLIGAQEDGRVAPAPDPRTIRYYASLGLLDRPSVAGREARYGRRHVLQLVAIKALQARGMALGEIQRELYGASNSELETLLKEVGRRRKPVEVHARSWREVVIEPGLKLMVEEGWSPRTDRAALEERIRAALAAVSQNGGVR
jgi:DNA-binding transcriptional MerR regulator